MFAGELPKTLRILREACQANGIQFQILDSYSGFVALISKGARSFPVCASKLSVYPLNRASSASIARDKTFAHYALKASGIAVPPGEYFFLRPPRADYVRPPGRETGDAAAYARMLSGDYTAPLIVKPNAGTGARGVHFVTGERGLTSALSAIAKDDEIALVQSYLDCPEYRLFVVDGQIQFCYRKGRPEICGDGSRSVSELYGLWIETNVPADMRKNAQVSPYLQWILKERGLSPDSVLDAGLSLPVDAVGNISAGGSFGGFVTPPDHVDAWAQDVARACSLRVTGIDVFSASGLEDVSDFSVTDVNGSPNLGTLYDLGYQKLVLEVWKNILCKAFDEHWPLEF